MRKTKHKFLVCKRSKPGSNIYLYIKDVYINYETSDINTMPTNQWNDKITTIDQRDFGGGCIWNSDVLVMDMEHENIIKQLKDSSVPEYLKCCLGFEKMLCDVSTLATDGEISTTHEFFE
jgi:hypothetical protein